MGAGSKFPARSGAGQAAGNPVPVLRLEVELSGALPELLRAYCTLHGVTVAETLLDFIGAGMENVLAPAIERQALTRETIDADMKGVTL